MAYNKRKKGYHNKKRTCHFCDNKLTYVDYKNVEDLKKFVNSVGSIKPKVATGNCAKHQRKVTLAVKRARLMALLPFAVARIRVHRSLVSAPASQNTKKSSRKSWKRKSACCLIN